MKNIGWNIQLCLVGLNDALADYLEREKRFSRYQVVTPEQAKNRFFIKTTQHVEKAIQDPLAMNIRADINADVERHILSRKEKPRMRLVHSEIGENIRKNVRDPIQRRLWPMGFMGPSSYVNGTIGWRAASLLHKERERSHVLNAVRDHIE